jgi:glycosyltransferase involved in cell wall biosynthesis
MKKRILIFSLAYYPKHIGGAEVAIKEITDRLDVKQYEFHLICNRYDSSLPKMEHIGNVWVHRIGFSKNGVDTADLFHPLFYFVKILYIPLAAYTAWQIHRKYHFDAFWSMMLYMTYPIALLRLLGIRVPYVATLQEGDTYEHVFERWYIKLFEPILLYGIRNAEIIQVISNFLGFWAKKKGFTGDVVLVPNGVDVSHFTQSYSKEDLLGVRSEFKFDDQDVLLTTTSRLVNKNAVDDIIRTVALLPQEVKLVVFGTGPDESKLRSLATELEVEDRVLFWGHIDHKDMPMFLKACDIFVRPSRSEGMGNSFIEAMAAELPIIATQEGGIADFLFDEHKDAGKDVTGWAVDADSPEQIRDAVRDIVNRPDKVQGVIKQAKEMVLEKYDWNLVAQRMETDVFEPLCDNTSKPTLANEEKGTNDTNDVIPHQ